jgi:ATP-dependent Clp protease ATP-binding subunit ClpA
VDNFNILDLDFPGFRKAREQIIANSFLLGQQDPTDAFTRLQSYLPDAPYFDSNNNRSPAPPAKTPPPPATSKVADVLDASQITTPKRNALYFDKAGFSADLKSAVIGQNQALDALTNLLALHVCKSKPTRPATAIFVGPTGTGKTLTAEQAAKLLSKHTDNDWDYIRIDMNQLTEAHHVGALLGAPAGYVGYDDQLLFEPLLKNKRCVILFDEMEKGHPAVLKVLMNAMGNGRLEATKPIDGQREFDFRYAVMLFTSNLPLSVENADQMTQTEITRACRDQLTKPVQGQPAMPPEIAARFSEILLFRNLSDADKTEILALTMMRTAEQYDLTVRKISPELMQNVVDRLSVDRGARDAICAIEAILGEPLAAFAQDHEGVKDVVLSGTSEQVTVKPYAG